MKSMIPASEISRRLADRCETVCSFLLPGGKEAAGFWRAGDLDGNAGKSVQVHLRGTKQGRWAEYAEGASDDTRGDLLDLWRVTRGITAGSAIKEAKDWLGISDPAVENKRKEYARPSSNGTKPLNFEGKACKYLTEKRLLSIGTLESFKVEIVPEKSAIVFPSYGPDGLLVNRSYRTLTEPKEVWQDKGCAPCLFGWQALSERAYAERTVLLSEGQIDAMTWHQWGFDALSLPNGSGQSWIDYEWENLAAFDKIYLAFDMDGSGKKNAESANLRLGRHRCLLVAMPEKDANDCLKAGYGAENAKEWLSKAQAPAFSGLVRGADMVKRLQAEIMPKPEPFSLPFLKIHWPDAGLYFRPAEVTVWTGFTSAGKSTFLNYLLVSAMCMQIGVFIASMEAKVETTMRKMMRAGIPASVKMTPELAEEFISQFGGFMTFADVVGYIKTDDLFEMMRFSFHRYGASHFLIDSLMRVDGLEEDYPAQGQFLNRLQEFAKQTDSHVHLVAHPRKASGQGRPDAMAIKGSSLIANNADNIVSINRNAEKDKMRKENTLNFAEAQKMFDTELVVEKQREEGWTGAFRLKFDPLSYTFGKMPAASGTAPRTPYKS